MDNEKTGRLIASIRKSKNMTQQDIAERLYITSKAVSKWERGLSFPSVDVLEKLSALLGVTVTELLAGERIEPADILQASEQISVRAIKKENALRRKTFWVSAAALTLFAALLAVFVVSVWSPAIFQRGNPLPYLSAAMRINAERPYVQVSDCAEPFAEVYITKNSGAHAELIEHIESTRGVRFVESFGSASVFSDGADDLFVSSEVYWGRYVVWRVPR
jgi:transcriptional regulator with XRE-family HTH domain